MNRYTIVEARSNMVVVRFGAAPFEWTVPLSTYDRFSPGDIVEIAVVKVGEVEQPANVTEFTLPSGEDQAELAVYRALSHPTAVNYVNTRDGSQDHSQD